MNENKSTKHIIVIGAGIIGSSIAFHLSERGARVTVLDAAQPGQGTSAVSFAWLNALDKRPHHYHDLNRRSIDMWDRLARRLGSEVGLIWGGELRWAATSEGTTGLAKRAQILQTWGYPIQLLSAQELKHKEPILATGPVAGASYSLLDGHVDTASIIRACLTQAADRGAVLRTQTRVVGLQLTQAEAEKKFVSAVQLEGDALTCDAVVLAGGPDTPELAALTGLEVPLYHTFGATILTEPIAPLFREAAVVHPSADQGLKIGLRQFADGSVMIQGQDREQDQGSLGRTETEIQTVLKAAARFVPPLAGVSIKEIRRGRRPIPKDGHPILGFTQAIPNLYLAVMHSGVTLAPLVGDLASLEIMASARVDLLEPYRLERF